MKKLFRRIKNNSGETIAETLIALLLSALALVMLAGAITTASGIIKRSSDKIEAYFDSANELAEIKDGSPKQIKIMPKEGTTPVQNGIDVYYKSNTVLVNNKPVTAFRLKK